LLRETAVHEGNAVHVYVLMTNNVSCY